MKIRTIFISALMVSASAHAMDTEKIPLNFDAFQKRIDRQQQNQPNKAEVTTVVGCTALCVCLEELLCCPCHVIQCCLEATCPRNNTKG